MGSEMCIRDSIHTYEMVSTDYIHRAFIGNFKIIVRRTVANPYPK